MAERERRTSERLNLQRPCKLYIPRIGRYLAGSTWNLSAEGGLLQLERPVPLEPGDRLLVGIALTRRQPIFCSADMVHARVTRVLPTDNDSIALAVRFVDEQLDLAPALAQAA